MPTTTHHREWGVERMQWILENWILVLVGGGMIAMHLFGHGHGHGGHKERKPPTDINNDDKSVQGDDVE